MQQIRMQYDQVYVFFFSNKLGVTELYATLTKEQASTKILCRPPSCLKGRVSGSLFTQHVTSVSDFVRDKVSEVEPDNRRYRRRLDRPDAHSGLGPIRSGLVWSL